MRALVNVLKMLMWGGLLLVVVVGIVGPATWLYAANSLPYPVESAMDVELHLRQSIESERQGVQGRRPEKLRESVKWETPDFSRLPKHLVAFYITETGCPDFFRSPKEQGWPWLRRVLVSINGGMLDGDGACELIFARRLARRLEAKEGMQLVVASDRIHRFLTKDQLVAWDLHSMWFDRGLIGVEKAAEVIMQKPLTQLTLAELAEFQLAIPPYAYWDDIRTCHNAAQLKEARDTILTTLAGVGHVTEEMARAAIAAPVRCLSVKR